MTHVVMVQPPVNKPHISGCSSSMTYAIRSIEVHLNRGRAQNISLPMITKQEHFFFIVFSFYYFKALISYALFYFNFAIFFWRAKSNVMCLVRYSVDQVSTNFSQFVGHIPHQYHFFFQCSSQSHVRRQLFLYGQRVS